MGSKGIASHWGKLQFGIIVDSLERSSEAGQEHDLYEGWRARQGGRLVPNMSGRDCHVGLSLDPVDRISELRLGT